MKMKFEVKYRGSDGSIQKYTIPAESWEDAEEFANRTYGNDLIALTPLS